MIRRERILGWLTAMVCAFGVGVAVGGL